MYLHCRCVVIYIAKSFSHLQSQRKNLFLNQYISVVNWFLLIREKLGSFKWPMGNIFLFQLLRGYDQILLFWTSGSLLVTCSNNDYYFYFNSMWKNSYRIIRNHSESWPPKHLPSWYQLYLAYISPTWLPDSFGIQEISSGVSLQLHKWLLGNLWHRFWDISWEVRIFCFYFFLNTKFSCSLAFLSCWRMSKCTVLCYKNQMRSTWA